MRLWKQNGSGAAVRKIPRCSPSFLGQGKHFSSIIHRVRSVVQRRSPFPRYAQVGRLILRSRRSDSRILQFLLGTRLTFILDCFPFLYSKSFLEDQNVPHIYTSRIYNLASSTLHFVLHSLSPRYPFAYPSTPAIVTHESRPSNASTAVTVSANIFAPTPPERMMLYISAATLARHRSAARQRVFDSFSKHLPVGRVGGATLMRPEPRFAIARPACRP